VVAAAVVLRHPEKIEHLDDSKKLSAAQREYLYRQIVENAVVGIGVVEREEIDEVNIFQASKRAMILALLDLPCSPDLVLIDGNARLEIPLAQKTIVGGDAKSARIAAASIVAKVYRDAWMIHLDGLYPGYGFKDHKGYATPEHLKRLESLGPSPVHRRSFAPCRPVLLE
jgi:ribonuclease HII